MATITITGSTIREAGTRRDNRQWKFRSVGYQYGGGTGGVVTTGGDWQVLQPVAGVLTFTAEAGIAAFIHTPDHHEYLVRIPEEDAGLWDVIEAGIAFPPNTAQDQLNAAVTNAMPPLVAAELEAQTADAISADLAEREITFTDEGDGEGYFSVGGVPVSGTLVPPAATWSGVAGRPSFGADSTTRDGVADDRAALAADDDSALAANLPLMLLPGTYKVSSDLTIDSPVWFLPGAIIKPDDGVTVTLAGGIISAPFAQIFDISAGGLVAVDKETDTYLEYFGAAGDGVTDDSTVIGNVIEGSPSGSVLHLLDRVYYVPSLRDVEVTGDITICGVPGKSKLLGDDSLSSEPSGDIMLFLQADASLRVEDVIVEDAGVLVGVSELTEVGDITINRCEFVNSGGVGVSTDVGDVDFLAGMAAGTLLSFNNLRLTDCTVTDCEVGLLWWVKGGWESVTVSGNTFTNTGFAAVWVGNEGVVDGSDARDPLTYQPKQSGVHIHDNTIRTVRDSDYTSGATGAANGIACWGQMVNIHDNYIEDVDLTAWTNVEGIYVKARYFDVHNNTLLDAGGSEAAIIAKGGDWQASTTLDAVMNGLTLPQATITVDSTTGFPESANESSQPRALVMSSDGWQEITWTGKTATTLTGCSGGTGTLSTGGTLRGPVHVDGYLVGQGYPGSIRDNTVTFTRGDVQQKGIQASVPHVVISGNTVVGPTGSAIAAAATAHDVTIRENTVQDAHGGQVFALGNVNCQVLNNTIINHDGSYVVGNLYPFRLAVPSDSASSGLRIEGNYLYNPLDDDGTLSAASSAISALRVQGNSTGETADDIVFSRNTFRNVLAAFSMSGSVTITNVSSVDNDFYNEAGAQPVVALDETQVRSIRNWPIRTVVEEIDFPSVAINNYQDVEVDVPGAEVGDPVVVGHDPGGAYRGLVFTAYVSEADKVKVRAANYREVAVDAHAFDFTILVLK